MGNFARWLKEAKEKKHPWEEAGLGKPPYRYLGMTENMYRPAPGVPAMPGGSCDYCGTGLRYEFWVESSDGKKFKVGSEHIRMTSSDSHLKKRADQDLKNHKKKVAKVQREKAREKLVSDTQHGNEILYHFKDLMKDSKHPSIPGKTLRDYVEFLLKNGGVTGKTKAMKMIDKALEKEGLSPPKPGAVKIPEPKKPWSYPKLGKTKAKLSDIANSTKKGSYDFIGWAEDEVELSKSGKAARIHDNLGRSHWIPVSILKKDGDKVLAPIWWLMQNRI